MNPFNLTTPSARKDFRLMLAANEKGKVFQRTSLPYASETAQSFLWTSTAKSSIFPHGSQIIGELLPHASVQMIAPTQTKWERPPKCGACYWNALHYCILHKNANYVLALQESMGQLGQHALVEENGKYLEVTLTPEERVDNCPNLSQSAAEVNCPQAHFFAESKFASVLTIPRNDLMEYYQEMYNIRLPYFNEQMLYFLPRLSISELVLEPYTEFAPMAVCIGE